MTNLLNIPGPQFLTCKMGIIVNLNTCKVFKKELGILFKYYISVSHYLSAMFYLTAVTGRGSSENE